MGKSIFDKNDSKRGFLGNKGFYIAIAICVIGTGAIAWVAVDNTLKEITAPDPNITMENNSDPDNSADNWSFPEVEDVLEPSENIPKDPPVDTPLDTPSEPDLPKEPIKEDTSSPLEPSQPSSEDLSPSEPSVNAPEPQEPSAPLENSPSSSKLVYMLPITGEVFNHYSNGELVKSKTMGDWRTHDGIDIKADVGTPVKAVANGQVTNIYSDQMWGTVIEILHENNITSIYSCLDDYIEVIVGDTVSIGDVLGSVSDSALAETALGPHLHFAMKDENGNFLDPLKTMDKI